MSRLIDPKAYELLGRLYLDALDDGDRNLLYKLRRATIISHSDLPIDSSRETETAYVSGFFDGEVQEAQCALHDLRKRRES